MRAFSEGGPRLWILGWVGSLGAHLVSYACLAGVSSAPERHRAPSTLNFEVKVVSPSRPEVPPARPTPPESVSRPTPPPPHTKPRERAIVPSTTPSIPESEPVDLTGVTLVGEGAGPGWSTVVGNGRPLNGPIQNARGSTPSAKGGFPEEAAARRQVGKAVEKPLDLVPMADLSRRPAPPALDGVLRSNYPAEARRQGLSGTAVVSVRIEPNGQVRSVQVRSESAPGFGKACQNTVLGSSWSPPLDRFGKPVATMVSYSCRFTVGS